MKIGVIGGGVAGICAAVQARDQGAEVLLFEASPHLGGRVAGGAGFDTGRHLAPTAYTAFLGLTDRLGSTAALQLRPLRFGAQVGNRLAWWSMHFGPMHGPTGAALALMASSLLPLLTRGKALRALKNTLAEPYREPGDAQLTGDGVTHFLREDHGTVAQLFAKHRWPRALIERVGLPLTIGMFNALPEEADAAVFVNALRRVLEDPDPLAGWARGNVGAVVSEPARVVLERDGIELRTSTRVKRVERVLDGWKILTRDSEELVDRLVVTAPPARLDFLADCPEAAELLQAAESIQGRSILTLRARFADAEALPGPLAEEEGEHAIWFSEPHPEGGVLVERVLSAQPSEPMPDLEGLQDDFLSRAEHLFNAGEPLAREVRFYPLATPSIPPGTPRPTLIQGEGLFYAGDWSATGLPATLESAARAGFLAGEVAALKRI